MTVALPDPHGPSRREYVLCALVAVVILLLAKPHNPALVMHGTLQDPDSYMTLLRLRDALDAGRWFGNVVSRDASGDGVALPWSHLMDGLILLLRAPLRLALPPAAALYWAGVLIGPLSVGVLGFLCAWAAAPLASRQWLWTAAAAASLAPPILNYGQLGDVTHHVALGALSVAAWGAAGRAAFGSLRAGGLAGCFAGLGIWLSPEAMPYGMMALGGIAVSWAVRPSPAVAKALAAAGSCLLAVIVLGLLLDPPCAGRAVPELDRLSTAFLALGLLACAACWVPCAPRLAGLALPARFAVMGIVGAAAASAWLALFPAYLRGLAGLMTPDQAVAFFGSIQEMQPLRTPGLLTLFALNGVLAVLAALAFAAAGLRAGRARPLPQVLWGYAGLCGAVSLAMAIMHLRFSIYPAAGAAVMLPVLVSRVSRGRAERWRVLLRPGVLAGFLCAPGLMGQMLVTKAEAEQAAPRKAGELQCPLQAASDLLLPYAGHVVLADVNAGPELLYRTGVSIVGSLYHANIAGYMRLRAAWQASDLDAAPPELAAAKADYVLICPDPSEAAALGHPPQTLHDRLNAGDAPAWLHPVAHEPLSGWILYGLAPEDAAPS